MATATDLIISTTSQCVLQACTPCASQAPEPQVPRKLLMGFQRTWHRCCNRLSTPSDGSQICPQGSWQAEMTAPQQEWNLRSTGSQPSLGPCHKIESLEDIAGVPQIRPTAVHWHDMSSSVLCTSSSEDGACPHAHVVHGLLLLYTIHAAQMKWPYLS